MSQKGSDLGGYKWNSEDTGTMASLDISLNDIPSDGLDYASQVTRMDLDLREGDPEFQGELEFTATIHAAEHEAWVAGDLRGVLLQECVRCLGVFKNVANIPVAAYYQSHDASATKEKPKGRKGKEIEQQGEETDSYPILNDRFNVAEMLRELLILSIPIQPLCQEHCQGLCQVCGQNLNQRQCGCDSLMPESPFAVLRDKLKSPQKSQR
jgi:uncharacterized protein